MTAAARVIWSREHRSSCVVAWPTDSADDVIAACRASGAVVARPPSDDGASAIDAPPPDVEYVVEFSVDAGPELVSEGELRRRQRGGALR